MSIAVSKSTPLPSQLQSLEFTETYAHGSVAGAETAPEQIISLGGADTQHASGITVNANNIQVLTAGIYFIDIYLEIEPLASGAQVLQTLINNNDVDTYVITATQRYFRANYVLTLAANDTISVRVLAGTTDTQHGDYIVYRLA